MHKTMTVILAALVPGLSGLAPAQNPPAACRAADHPAFAAAPWTQATRV